MQGLYFRSSATSIPASISAGSRRAFTAFWKSNWSALAQQLAQTILPNGGDLESLVGRSSAWL